MAQLSEFHVGDVVHHLPNGTHREFVITGLLIGPDGRLVLEVMEHGRAYKLMAIDCELKDKIKNKSWITW